MPWHTLLLVTLFLGNCSSLAEAPEPQPQEETVVLSPTEFAESLVTLVNRYRAQGCTCGSTYYPPAPPIQWNSKLEKAAQKHSQEMDKYNYFDHKGRDGSSVGSRASAVGYNWSSIAENIAWNYPDIPAVIAGWIDSPGHCRNLMNKSYTEMGVGKSGPYWTQVLARPNQPRP